MTSPITPSSFSTGKLLIVEGEDEKRIVSTLIKRLVLDINIQPDGGKDKFRRSIEAIAQTEEFRKNVRVLGIMRDADNNADAAFQSVQDSLKNAGLPFPGKPNQLTETNPKIAVMIVPHGRKKGILEDIFLDAIPEDAKSCINTFISCIDEAGLLKTSRSKITHAKVYSYISISSDPRARLGESAEQGCWDEFNHKSFDGLKEFVELLCKE